MSLNSGAAHSCIALEGLLHMASSRVLSLGCAILVACLITLSVFSITGVRAGVISGRVESPRPSYAVPRGGFHFPSMAPSAAGPYYMQEGATIASLNGNPNYGFSAVYVQVEAVPSPYPTGYELNGLSNTGDWFQFLIADNWPGCSAGFTYAFEVWNDSGGSVELSCFPPVGQYAISSGDMVTLGLNFSGSNVCMDWSDISGGRSGIDCVAQPNSGGFVFQSLQQAANPHGYFTGPMTEVVEPSATSCQTYSSVPTQNYRFVQGAYVSSFYAWSEEFQLGGSAPCYTYASLQISETPGDYTPIFVEATGGSIYGPHWEDASNTSAPPSAFWWTFSTDRPPALVSVSRTTADLGQSVVLSGSTDLGAPPFSFEFVVDGTVVGSGASSYIWIPHSTGNFSVRVEVFNVSGSLVAESSNVSVSVSPDPVAPTVASNVASGEVDAAQSVTFWMNATGGGGGLSISWHGLPSGCQPTSTFVVCSEVVAGTYLIYAVVNDSNGMSVTSPVSMFVVNAAPTVTLLVSADNGAVGSNATFLAVVSGGSAPLRFAWQRLPGDCSEDSRSSFSIESCVLNGSGPFTVSVTVTDRAGVSSSASLHLAVTAPSSGQGSSFPWWAYLAIGAAGGAAAAWLAAFSRRKHPGDIGPVDGSGRIGAGFAPDLITAEPGAGSGRAGEPAAPYWEVQPPADPTCRRCGNVNPPGSLYCGKCAIPLEGGARPPGGP